ncbi:MAG: LysR family transcriptional regulator [Pseudomonadota bacterium]|jgi:DNA-binding transcriptional LysR family regulator|nr:LysR family transcriptional regulator [Burkholderia sp. PAMC 28687]AMM15744.1 LysR family transcriptional regulator [Burkholderia sp. PAMC 28687]MDP9155624.1 LysR family transcriptional regulator [Pseudomonadota bacterium]
MSFDGRTLANISVLAAIVEGGSFARAADALGLSPSGVSRAVGRLETSIGVRLLDRTTRSVMLTDEGRRLYEEIGPLLAGIGDAVTMTAGASAAVQGRLRVNVDAYFSRRMLAVHLARFLERYPELSLELVTRDQLGDLVADGFDIAVRFGQPPSSSLVARKLLETRTVTVAAPSYIRKHGRPETPADLIDHACIQMRNSLTGEPMEWEYKSGRKTVPAKTSGRLLLNDAGTLLGACLAGAGIARLKASGVQDLIDKGRLVQLLPEWTGEAFALYALYPSRHLPAAKVRAFIDFVIEILAADS